MNLITIGTFTISAEDREAYRREQESLTSPGRVCMHPACTGVHDNNRCRELCPAALARKREKDNRYYFSGKGCLARARKTQFYASNPRAYAELAKFVNSGEADELARRALASDDPAGFIVRETWASVFAGHPYLSELPWLPF
jgi:hypothetical protein